MIKRKTIKKFNEIQSCGIGVLTAVLIMVFLLGVSTICINNEYFINERFNLFAIAIQIISCCLGGIVAGAIGGWSKKITCAVVGGVVLVLQLATALLIFEGVSGDFCWLIFATVIAVSIGYILEISKAKRVNSHRSTRHR